MFNFVMIFPRWVCVCVWGGGGGGGGRHIYIQTSFIIIGYIPGAPPKKKKSVPNFVFSGHALNHGHVRFFLICASYNAGRESHLF